MKAVLNIRHRPKLDESIERRFETVVSSLHKLKLPWGIGEDVTLRLPPIGTRLATHVKLRGKLGKGLSGELTLRYRAAANLHDNTSSDDFLLIEFQTDKVEWSELAATAMPHYVEALEAYIAGMSYWDSMPREWRELSAIERTLGLNLDGRDGVFRFGPLTFMDAELCRRGCGGLTPGEVVARLRGIVPQVTLLLDGVFIVAATEFPREQDIARVDRLIREALGLGPAPRPDVDPPESPSVR